MTTLLPERIERLLMLYRDAAIAVGADGDGYGRMAEAGAALCAAINEIVAERDAKRARADGLADELAIANDLIASARHDVGERSFLEDAQRILQGCVAPYSCEQMKAVADALRQWRDKWAILLETVVRSNEERDKALADLAAAQAKLAAIRAHLKDVDVDAIARHRDQLIEICRRDSDAAHEAVLSGRANKLKWGAMLVRDAVAELVEQRAAAKSELAAVMQLAVDKWLDDENGNAATRAARAREVALREIDAATKRADGLAAELAKAKRALEGAGWVDNGGEAWKPPLGPSPSPLLGTIDALRTDLAAANAQRDELLRAAVKVSNTSPRTSSSNERELDHYDACTDLGIVIERIARAQSGQPAQGDGAASGGGAS